MSCGYWPMIEAVELWAAKAYYWKQHRAQRSAPYLKGTEPPEENALGTTPVQAAKAQETLLRDGL